MLNRTAPFLAVLAATLLLAASASAAMIGIYRNGLDSLAQRSQLVKLVGRECARGGSTTALQVAVGKRTEQCSFRTPVVGRDLEIAANMRVLGTTPKAVQNKAFLGLELRAGGGAKYQLLVFPKQRKAQLRKVLPGGEVQYLRVARDQEAIKGIDMVNGLRLRTTNVVSGPEKGLCQIAAFVGGAMVAEAADTGAGALVGRASAVTVGGLKNGNGVNATIDDVVVRIPSPY